MAFLLSMMGFRLWSEICLIVSTTTANTIVGNETDRLALPAFKTMITQDPHGIVNSWNNSDHFCEWKGVRCSHRHKGVTIIDLQFRDLVGSLSPHIGNLSLLHELRLNNNTFQGEIPAEIGNLFRLQKLNLSINNFEGEILANLSRCSNLTYLGVGFKNLVGKFPEELTSLSKLIYLGIHLNNLTRGIPPFIGNLTSLVRITAAYNPFGGSIPDTLGQLKNLNFLGLGVTQFCGMIPSSIYNLSLLTTFSIPYNQLHGSLPPGFGSMFPPSSNPPAIWQPIYWTSSTFNIQFFRTSMYSNQFTGKIPPSIGNLQKLQRIEGTIPSSLGNCQNLLLLHLFQSNLSGTIPGELLRILSLSISLNLAQNHLFGSLPADVGNLKNLMKLDISENGLSGEIPSSLVFVLKHPLVPSAVFGSTKLWQLQQVLDAFKIDIELVNTHTGIDQLIEDGPKLDSLTISSITVVSYRWLSCNFLLPSNVSKRLLQEFVEKHGNGFEVVSTLSGWWKNNPSVYHIRLVSGPKLLDLKKPVAVIARKSRVGSSRNEVKTLTSILTARNIDAADLDNELAVVVYVEDIYKFYKLTEVLFWLREKDNFAEGKRRFKIIVLEISYEKLFKATDGFTSTNLIGFGSFGSVYKGILDQDGEVVAVVKVLNLQNRGAAKSFMAECETLRNIRHQNLVRIITSCSSVDFQGNEFKALPSNILLDHDMVARVGDFGLARFCPELTIPNQSSSIGIRGSIGYVPPEYGLGSEMSTYGDVYSYRILLLEVITGKRPTDSMFEEGLNLSSFARMAFPDHVMEIVDPMLLDNDEEEAGATAAVATAVGASTWELIQEMAIELGNV
ncbi:hypothetical protein TEA_022300 [Camellia sinensis var. sinensis]|uniref:Protein kinase domain-containing protein n=1 Tax=Camellia sinensis var. sinensis TaxID=542762 RepID=A0A4S4D915_CAMSN|nr:hypothetical protein TEA_022300 [Camellia sinensis var. sinensis]